MDRTKLDGLEFEALLDLEGGWRGTLAYSFIKTKVIKGDSYVEGHRLSGVPDQTASLWLNYGFQEAPLRGLELGAGGRYVGESYDGSDQKKTPDVLLYDGRISYDWGRWDLGLSAQNIADKEYLSACELIGSCFYGSRRKVNLTMKYSF